MKNKLFIYLIAFYSLLVISIFAQEKVSIQLNVFEPLPQISFAAFLSNSSLENTPRIFQVIMSPHEKNVIVKGAILWRRADEDTFNELVNITTKPFTSRDFYNNDFSAVEGISLEEKEYNDALLDENKKIGKPSGTYRIVIKVFDENMEFQDEATSDLDFLNPAPTLSIIQPSLEDVLDIAGIQVSWNAVPGVSEYIVKANTRSSKFESLEDALQKGKPLVDNKGVGLRTSINLRDILDRELVGGEEVVLQVRGVVPAPGGPTIIYSDIVNFYLKDASTPVVDKGIKDFTTMLTQVLDTWENEGNGNSDAFEKLQQLLDDIKSGKIDFNKVSIRFDNGEQLTYAEFQQVLLYLRNNPDLLTGVLFREK